MNWRLTSTLRSLARADQGDHLEGRYRRAASRKTFALLCAAVTAGGLSAIPAPTSAAAVVDGPADAVQLRADNASIREVLDALSAKFTLTYKLPPASARVLTGLYAGTLNQVLARVLDGSNYFVKVSDNEVEIVVVATTGGSAPGGPTVAEMTAPAAMAPSKPVPPMAQTPVPVAQPSLPQARSIPPLTSYLSANDAAGRP